MMGQSKTRLLGVTVLVAMFAVGGLTGAVLQRTVLADNTKPSQQAQVAHGPSLFEQLKLTEAQQTQVCTILERQKQKMSSHDQAFREGMERLKREHKPAVDSIVGATYEEMDALLTAEQRATKDRYREERKKYYAEREAKEKELRAQGQAQGGPRREGDRGGRPNPMNPLGVSCPGLNDGPHGPRGGGPGWDGDSSKGKHGPRQPADAKKPAPQSPVTTNEPREA